MSHDFGIPIAIGLPNATDECMNKIKLIVSALLLSTFASLFSSINLFSYGPPRK